MHRFRVYGYAGNRRTYIRADGFSDAKAALAYVSKHYPHFNVFDQWGQTLVLQCK